MSRNDLANAYASSLFRRLGLRATWLPTEKIQLGAVGFLRGGVFSQQTTLRKLGVEYETEQGNARAVLQYQSSSGVNVDFKAAGEEGAAFTKIGRASAGVRVSFSRAGGIVFSVPKYTTREISNRAEVALALKPVRDRKEWHRDYRVVTRTYQAQAATILVSDGRRGVVELRAEGDLALGDNLDIASIGTGFKLAWQDDMAIAIVASGGLTPLFVVDELTTPIRRGRKPHLRPAKRRKAAKKAAAKKAPAKKHKATKRKAAKKAPAKKRRRKAAKKR